jgi:hypothetical protein
MEGSWRFLVFFLGSSKVVPQTRQRGASSFTLVPQVGQILVVEEFSFSEAIPAGIIPAFVEYYPRFIFIHEDLVIGSYGQVC